MKISRREPQSMVLAEGQNLTIARRWDLFDPNTPPISENGSYLIIQALHPLRRLDSGPAWTGRLCRPAA